jgi:hypothetical protein
MALFHCLLRPCDFLIQCSISQFDTVMSLHKLPLTMLSQHGTALSLMPNRRGSIVVGIRKCAIAVCSSSDFSKHFQFHN